MTKLTIKELGLYAWGKHPKGGVMSRPIPGDCRQQAPDNYEERNGKGENSKGRGMMSNQKGFIVYEFSIQTIHIDGATFSW